MEMQLIKFFRVKFYFESQTLSKRHIWFLFDLNGTKPSRYHWKYLWLLTNSRD